MIVQREGEPRIEYLARVLHHFMGKNGAAAECVIEYDGVECDGACLSNDFLYELDLFNLDDL